MKKIYQTPTIIVSVMVSENIIAASNQGSLNPGQSSGSETGGGRAEVGQSRGDWDNIWGE